MLMKLVLAWDRQRKCGCVKPVNGIPAPPPFDTCIYNDSVDINKQ